MLQRESVALAGACVLLILVSLAGALFVLLRGEISEQGLDALFLLAVCGVFAAVFALIAVDVFRKGLLTAATGARGPASADSRSTEKAKAGAEVGKPAGAAEGPKTAREA